MCRTLWAEKMSEEYPRGLSFSICQLRDSNVVPGHQANMMLTLAHLRNQCVYEDLDLGENELQVAHGAWAIVNSWWKASRD